MKKDSGKSRVILIFLIILLIIGVSVAINYANDMVAKTKVQDLRTNMLLMQAKVKKGLEEVCFQTVNLNETKEEDLAQINEIKQEFLMGTILSNSPEEVQRAAQNVPNVEIDDNCYYLDENILGEMGIKNIDTKEFGYFIVKYDFKNANIEVINTKGNEGNYTLTQMVETLETEQTDIQKGVE